VKFRATRYRIVSASSLCPACGAWTQVVALVVPAEGQETLDASLHYVEHIPESVQSRVRALAPWYRLTAESYWANHCEHCDTRQDEYELHCEPGGAFMPAPGSPAQAALRLSAWDIPEPIAAIAGGVSHDPPF
jgi:hypothetical protein